MQDIHHEVWIGAPSSIVFEAITSREGLDAWWGRALAGGEEPGAVVEFDHGFGEGLRFRVTGLDPGTRVMWRCLTEITEPRNPASEWLGHRITFHLRNGGGEPAVAWLAPRLGWPEDPQAVTILDFRHAGWLPDSRWQAFCNLAWGATLEGLSRHCAGAAGPVTPA